MAAYFYTRNKQKQGPVSSSELKQLAATGQLQPTDQVMKEGTSKWVPAGSIKGLFPANIPPAQPMSAPPPPLPESSEPSSGGSRVLLWFVLLVVLGGLGAGGVMFMGKSGDGDGKASDKNSGGGKQAKGKDGGGKDSDSSEVVDKDPGSRDNAKRKIEAWRAFVDAFTMNFEDEATRKEHLEKCDKLLEDYLKVPFDPLKFTEEAREITKTYQRKNLQAQYPFWEPHKKLDANVQEIKTELLRGTDTK